MKEELGLDLDEFLMLNLMISSMVSVFTYMYLSYAVPQVSRIHVFTALTLLVLLQGVVFHMRRWRFTFYRDLPVLKVLQCEIAVITSCLVSSALVLKRFTPELWIGNDPWETAIVCRNIIKLGLSPTEALSYYETFLTMSHPVFYYLVSLVSLVCEVDVDLIVRSGPLVFAAVCGTLTYLAVKRVVNPAAGLVAPVFLFLNPFFNFRFSMLLRENLSIMILVLSFTLLHARRRADYRILPGFVIVNGLLLAAITITHPFTVLFLLGIMVVYIYIDHVNNGIIFFKEAVISSILCIVLIIPNIIPMYIPVNYFLINNRSSIDAMIIISVSVFIASVLTFVYINKIWRLVNTLDVKWVRGVYVGVILLLFSYIIFKPTILSNYMYEYIRLNMFSTIVIVLGVLGFIFEPSSTRNVMVSSMTVSVSLLVCVYLLGVAVPLDRTAVYTAWILSYYASLYFSKLLDPFTLRLVSVPHNLRDVAGLLKNSQQYLVLLFLLSTVVYWEASALRPSFTEFSSADIDSARLFVSSLEKGDLVIPIKTNYIIQYVDVPRDYVVTTHAEREWMWRICGADTPDQLFVDAPERFAGVKRLKFCLLFNDLFGSRSLKPSKEFLEEYGGFNFYGSLIVFTVDVPYDETGRPLNRVKYVSGVSDESILSGGSPDDLGVFVTGVSNIVVDPSQGMNRYRLYYVGEDRSGIMGIWCALSSDGLTWERRPEPVILGEYSEPFVMVDNGAFRLFCDDTASNEVISLSSQDGVHWSGKTVIAANQDASNLFWRASSPVVWAEGGSYHIIYEETTVSEQGSNVSLVQLTSEDCSSWTVQNRPLRLWAVDYSFWTVKLDRVLIDDVVVTDEGTIFVVRALRSTFSNKTWVTGTLFMKPGRPDQSYFQEIELMNFPAKSGTVDAVHVLLDSGTGAPIFYVYEQELGNNSGAGLYIGHPIAAPMIH
ncbi:MAG: hypothetical protein ABIJ47_05835 [Candidatus Bathyarchaeota archaeon]